MSEQLWNFAGIEGGASEIQGSVATTAGLLDEGKGSLAALAAIWGGRAPRPTRPSRPVGTPRRGAEQRAAESRDISEAGSTMAQTEAGVTGMFA